MINLSSIGTDEPVLIAGPTASGKSALALAIAETAGGTIVNADALQVYECWHVLSARPSSDDLARAPHALYGHIARSAAYSVGDWLTEVAQLLKQGERPIFVGGTGLYLTSLAEGLSDVPPVPQSVRARADSLRQQDYPQMIAELQKMDATLAERIDLDNPMRVQRGWEVFTATGRPLSAWQARKTDPMIELGTAKAFVLDAPKDWLTPRIEMRFKGMFENGAVDEVRTNLPYWKSGAPWTRAIGASEIRDFLLGNLTKEDALEHAIIATRQYAKRQRTWFRARMSTWQKLDASSL